MRRADRKLASGKGEVHIPQAVPEVPEFRDFQPPLELLLGDVVVPVASLDDVKRMKERKARPKDLLDLAELESLGDLGGER